jgi:hypothetical protein
MIQENRAITCQFSELKLHRRFDGRKIAIVIFIIDNEDTAASLRNSENFSFSLIRALHARSRRDILDNIFNNQIFHDLRCYS